MVGRADRAPDRGRPRAVGARGRFRHARLQLRERRRASRATYSLSHLWHAALGRGRRAECRAHTAWHGRLGCPVSQSGVRGRAIRPRSATRHQRVFR